MTAQRHNAATLAGVLAQRAPILAAELLPAGRHYGRNWRVGSLAGEPGGSLSVCLSGPDAGGWVDFATEERGDALDLVAAVLFCGRMRDAWAWTRAWLGLAHAPVPQSQRRPMSKPQQNAGYDDADRTARAREAWLTSHALPGTPAATYLIRRLLPSLASCSVLRWCQNTAHPSGGRHPAMLALVQDVDGTSVGIHRIYLTASGSRPPDLSPAKASLGRISGGAVRLTLDPTPPPLLVLGEGVESNGSAGLILDLPAWAALSTSGLRSLALPYVVRQVVIAADHDANGAGQRAAEAAAGRWRAEGRAVRIALPDLPGQDFNDILRDRVRRAAEATHG